MPRRSSTSRSKKKSKRTSKKKRAFTFTWPSREVSMRAGIVALWLVAIGGVAVGAVAGMPHLRDYTSRALHVDRVSIKLPDYPGWLEPHGGTTGEQAAQLDRTKRLISDSINEAIAGRIGPDPLNRDDLVDVRTALEQCGWFSEVHRVSRPRPGSVVIDATYAEPFTMIRDSEGSHLVTENGILLPLSFPPNAKLERMPLVTGAYFSRPWQFGEHWEGTDIEAALELVRLLEGHAWTHQIVEVDCSEFMQTESLWLTTDTGARMLWGRAPGDERGREVPAEQKLAYIQSMYSHSGRVDRHLRQLDLVFDVVYSR